MSGTRVGINPGNEQPKENTMEKAGRELHL